MTSQQTVQPTDQSTNQEPLNPAQVVWLKAKATDRLRRSVKKGGKLKVFDYYWSSTQLEAYVGQFVIVVQHPKYDNLVYVYKQDGEFITSATRGVKYR